MMMVPAEGFEPPASGLQNRCSTPELRRQPERIMNESPNGMSKSVQMAAQILRCQPLTRLLTYTFFSGHLDFRPSIVSLSLNGIAARVQTVYPGKSTPSPGGGTSNFPAASCAFRGRSPTR